MLGLGLPELIIILVIILILFGTGKLSSVGTALGKGFKSFKKGEQEEYIDVTPSQEKENNTKEL
ncbi:MAG: twin-arginine translocase TatA/TatE family subunit [Nitrospinae bacterium]|nr:twin-arginine translocase TatA/TatE family subunit [Nitrospinota bacterium]